MNEDQTLRRDCLEIALRHAYPGCDASVVVSAAQAYFDYIRGTNDAEVLRAARDLAATVDQGAKR